MSTPKGSEHDVQTTRREVQSRDPSLSDEANELVTAELRDRVGADTVAVPVGSPDHRATPHATHSAMAASAWWIRPLWVIIGAIVAMTALIGVIATTSSWLLVGLASVLFLPVVFVIARMTMRMFDEQEHLDPEVASVLQAEGVADPDKHFSELVAELDGRDSCRTGRDGAAGR